MGLDIFFLKEQRSQLPAFTPADTAQSGWEPVGDWVPCSPEWINAGGDCEHAPRVDHHGLKQHFHPPVKEKMADFRKLNALFRWVEDHVTLINNQETLEISRDVLEQLGADLARLNKDNAAEVFPVQGGFFFGPTEYDDDYLSYAKELQVWVEARLQDFDFDRYRLYLWTWW